MLQGITTTTLSVRPALQRELWATNCISYLPCPYPNKALRTAKPATDSDDDVYQQLVSDDRPILTRWLDALAHPPSPSSLFHADDPLHRHFVPGETVEDQELSVAFQEQLYALQNPPDCSTAKILIMDYFHDLGGFGSWTHARALALGLGMRQGRTVIELPGKQGYPQGYSECTRVKGLGGCDMFLPASSCPIPDNWKELIEKDKQEFNKKHAPWPGGGGGGDNMQRHLDALSDRRIVQHTEYYVDGEPYELYHTNPTGWDRGLLRSSLAKEFDAYRMMPECWWNRQLLSWHWRMRPEAQHTLLSLTADSLKLDHGNTTADNAMAYANALAPTVNHTAHWWLSIQALKLEWQARQLAPQLIAAMRKEVKGETLSEEEVSAMVAGEDERRIPLLGYSFIRHGDKAVETAIIDDPYFFNEMSKASKAYGLSSWYIGADDLLSADHLRVLNAEKKGVEAVQLYTSVLVDAIEDKENHPLVKGFAWQAAKDADDSTREGIIWRTVLEFGVAQVADAFISMWGSNHPRMTYEMATAMSDARATAPFIGLGDIDTPHRKGGHVEGCENVVYPKRN